MRVIPKQFDLFGQRITVETQKNFAREQGCLGKWHPYQLKIVLQEPDEEHAQSVILQTFWHEAIHACLDLLGHTDLSENEVLVEQLGQAIFQVLKTKR